MLSFKQQKTAPELVSPPLSSREPQFRSQHVRQPTGMMGQAYNSGLNGVTEVATMKS